MYEVTNIQKSVEKSLLLCFIINITSEYSISNLGTLVYNVLLNDAAKEQPPFCNLCDQPLFLDNW